MSDYFYGWYFRCQGSEGCIAVIPAVHLSAEKRTCSIQVITQKGSLYREFPVSLFRINRKKGIMKIGENLFSRKGIYLYFTTSESEEIDGTLRFGRFTEPEYDTEEEKNEDNSHHSRKDKRKIFKRRHRRIQQETEPLLQTGGH